MFAITDVNAHLLSYLPDINDLKACRGVSKPFKNAVDQLSHKMLLQLTLEVPDPDSSFKRIVALDDLRRKWMIEPDLSRLPSSCSCCNPKALHMELHAKLTDSLLKRIPPFATLFDFVTLAATIRIDLGYPRITGKNFVDITHQAFSKHPGSRDLQTAVINQIKEILFAIRQNNLHSTKFLLENNEKADSGTISEGLVLAAESPALNIFMTLLNHAQKHKIAIAANGLQRAALNGGNLDIIKASEQIENSSKNHEPDRATLLSAAKHELATFQYFWDKASDKNPNNYGNPVFGGLLHMASVGNRIDVLQHLFNMGMTNPNDICGHQNEYQPLHCAAENNSLEAAQFLFTKGAFVNVQNRHGLTPLIMASYWGYFPLMRFLIENGADVNMIENSGNSALIFALLFVQRNFVFTNESSEIIQELLKKTSFLNKLHALKIQSLDFTMKYKVIRSFIF